MVQYFTAIFSLTILTIFDGGSLDEDEPCKCTDSLFCFGIVFCLPIAIIIDFVTYPIQFIIINLILYCRSKNQQNRNLDLNDI